MTIESLLDDLFELLKDEDHWTQRGIARKADGTVVPATHPDAVKWCLLGGVGKVASSSPYEFVLTLNYLLYQEAKKTAALAQIHHQPVTGFNDTSTHSQVLDLIDAARKSLRNES
jgi:hypothetical protein